MKTLYLIRHAKSSWDNSDLDDFDRPLNHRGLRDAPRMGKRLRERHVVPDLILSSSALRARTTAHMICEAMLCPMALVTERKDLYHAGDDRLTEIVKKLPEQMDTVFIVAHNPGLTEFANLIQTDRNIANIPTTGVVAVAFNTDTWAKAVSHGELILFDYPKKKE